jgi:hypothetical protein
MNLINNLLLTMEGKDKKDLNSQEEEELLQENQLDPLMY